MDLRNKVAIVIGSEQGLDQWSGTFAEHLQSVGEQLPVEVAAP